MRNEKTKIYTIFHAWFLKQKCELQVLELRYMTSLQQIW